MSKQLNWGILSTAKIGLRDVIPAIQKSDLGNVVAICSRDIENAKQAAKKLDIPTFYGNYEDLINDNCVDVIYNPLPNKLHIPFTIKAIKSGKHVLCEKPISTNYREVLELLEIKKEYPNCKVMEAFMYRFHPQWELVKKIIRSGEIGQIKHLNSTFCYFNNDPLNIKNQADLGGGGLLDVGCYCVNFSRFIFEDDPYNTDSFMEFDPVFKTDRIASGLLKFKNGSATFMCGMQVEFDQKAEIFGSLGKIEVAIPFNDAMDLTRKVTIKKNRKITVHEFEAINPFLVMINDFSKSIINNSTVTISLEDSLANMKVISQLFSNYK